MAETGFAEKTNKKAIGYCPVCHRPFKWHKNELDFSQTLGVVPMWKCFNGHDQRVQDKNCLVCGTAAWETPCQFLDGSRPGYAWGIASRKPAREYHTGNKIDNEICGYQNPEYPGYPCVKKRGHDEESELGIQHDHGEVPHQLPKPELFPEYKKVDNLYIKQE